MGRVLYPYFITIVTDFLFPLCYVCYGINIANEERQS